MKLGRSTATRSSWPVSFARSVRREAKRMLSMINASWYGMLLRKQILSWIRARDLCRSRIGLKATIGDPSNCKSKCINRGFDRQEIRVVVPIRQSVFLCCPASSLKIIPRSFFTANPLRQRNQGPFSVVVPADELIICQYLRVSLTLYRRAE